MPGSTYNCKKPQTGHHNRTSSNCCQTLLCSSCHTVMKCPKRRRHRLCAFLCTRIMQAPCKKWDVYFSNKVKTVTSNTNILWKVKFPPLEMVTIWKPGRKCQYDASMCRLAVHVGVSAAAKISRTRRRFLSCSHCKPKRTPVDSLWCVCMPKAISK